jgi:hypothetical protein
MTDQPDTLVTTRIAWHTVAEQVLARALYDATGRIGLRVFPGGFGTPPFDGADGPRQLLVVIDELVVRGADGERSAPLTTVRAAAELAHTTAGAPAEVYPPATPSDLDAPLAIDPKEARRLADWFALGNDALGALRAEHASDEPALTQLWPEHFDLGTTIKPSPDDGVNFGVSPGDAEHPTPYLYVGPWKVPEGEFWNEPFGASRSWDDIADVDEAVAFLREGYAKARH